MPEMADWRAEPERSSSYKSLAHLIASEQAFYPPDTELSPHRLGYKNAPRPHTLIWRVSDAALRHEHTANTYHSQLATQGNICYKIITVFPRLWSGNITQLTQLTQLKRRHLGEARVSAGRIIVALYC